jgi:hypothetical protein
VSVTEREATLAAVAPLMTAQDEGKQPTVAELKELRERLERERERTLEARAQVCCVELSLYEAINRNARSTDGGEFPGQVENILRDAAWALRSVAKTLESIGGQLEPAAMLWPGEE